MTEPNNPHAYAAGCSARRRILGDAYADRTEQAAAADALTDESKTGQLAHTFHTLASQHAWGAVWPRTSALDDRARSIATIGLLIVMGNKEELELHLEGTVRNGLYTPAQVAEIIHHSTAYAGYPLGLTALQHVKETPDKALR